MGGEVLQRRWCYPQDFDTYVGAPRELIVDIVNWRMSVHDGQTPGGHPLAKRSELEGLAVGVAAKANRGEIAPTYGAVYNGEVIGSAESGKSFSSDISTQADFKIAPVADLPDGWSITVKFAGQSAVARLFTASGNFVYRGSVMPTEFAVVGYGEAFRLTKFAGAIYIMVLEHPPRLTVAFNWPGTGAWNTASTAWTTMQLTAGDSGVNLGLATLANYGGLIRVAGEYSIKGSFSFHVSNPDTADYAHFALRRDGAITRYEHELIRYGDHFSRELVEGEYLAPGQRIDLAFLSSNAIALYLTHYSTLTLSLKGR